MLHTMFPKGLVSVGLREQRRQMHNSWSLRWLVGTLMAGMIFFASVSEAAVAVDSTPQNINSSSETTTIDLPTFTVGTGANRVLVAILAFGKAATPMPTSISVTWDPAGANQALTGPVVTQDSSTGLARAQIWTLVAPVSGNKILRASWTNSSSVVLGAIEFSGADQTNPIVTADNRTATGYNNSPPAQVTIPSAANDATVAASAYNTGTPTMNQSLIYSNGTPSNLSSGANYALGGTSNTHTDSGPSGNYWAMVGVHVQQVAPTQVYYSVGQNASTNHMTGSPTCEVNGNTITFNIDQEDAHMGVGLKVTYGGTNVCYISGKMSSTVWTCTNATGGTPTAAGAGTTVNSIRHAFASLNAAVGGASPEAAGASYLNTTNLTTGNYVLNIPCYYDTGADTTAVAISDWTTGANNYIKVYTPNNTSTECNQSQRHNGKWDTGKYRLEVSNSGAITIGGGASRQEEIVRLDGLQIYVTSVNADWTKAVNLSVMTGTTDLRISNCIIRGAGNSSNQGHSGIDTYDLAGTGTVKIWNNIIYDFRAHTDNFGIASSSCTNITFYLYNNTIYNCSKGFTAWAGTSGTVIAKNNISYSNATYNYYESPGFSGSSTNNLSGPTFSDAPGSNPQNAKTLNFASTVSPYNLHLASNDTNAIDKGAVLSGEFFSDDIDGQSRLGGFAWDIGADEYKATQVYYSVGQNTSTDHKTGSPTCEVNGNTITFNTDQEDAHMGVGLKVTYGGSNVCYISGKTSKKVWSCTSATGGTPTAATAGTTVNSITHAYASLSLAESGIPTALGTSDLVANNYVVNIPCYYDSGADTTAATISGWTTGPNNYIKIYTPNNVWTECNQSQRHTGKWDPLKYSIQAANVYVIQTTGAGNVWIDGLQIYLLTANTQGVGGIAINQDGLAADHRISNNIIRGVTGTATAAYGIYGSDAAASGNSVRIWNNIVFGFGNSVGIYSDGDQGASITFYAYNNTVYLCKRGYYRNGTAAGPFIAKNNISYNNSQDNYNAGGSTFDASSTNNLSGPTFTDAPGSNPQNAKTLNFVDTVSPYDLHLASSDTNAINKGAVLSGDTYLSFSDDIDGQSRPGTSWDIGADEYVLVILVLEQEGFRFRLDDGTEAGATWATQDTEIKRDKNLNTRLRVLLNATGDPPSTQYQLEYKKSTDSTYSKVLTAQPTTVLPTYVAAGTRASGTGDIAPPLPTGILTNDILLLFVESGNEAISISNPNGGTWTQAPDSPQGVGTAPGDPATRLAVFWSRYNGTQGAPTVLDPGDHAVGRIIAIRGCIASGDPFDVTAGGTEGVSDTSGSIPGDTTTVNNTLVVVAITSSYLAGANGTAEFSGWSNADLTNLTERTDNIRIDGNGGGIGTATGEKASAGSYGATSVTLVNAAYKAMWTGALKPVPATQQSILISASSNIAASGENTTAQLTPPSGKTTSNFTTGRIQDDENPADAVDIDGNYYTELEWCLIATDAAQYDDVYQFRVTANGVPLTTYSVTPQWTIQAQAPTAITLLSFTATQYSEGVLLKWKTGYEVDNLGFHIYREENGERVRLTPEPVAGSALLAGKGTALGGGHHYVWWDAGVSSQSSSIKYRLKDIDLNGTHTMHGPVTPVFSHESLPARLRPELLSEVGMRLQERYVHYWKVQELKEKIRSRGLRITSFKDRFARGSLTLEAGKARSLASSPAGTLLKGRRPGPQGNSVPDPQTQQFLASKSAVKILVKEEGWYRVTQSELVAAGLSPRANPRHLQLYTDGKEQPIRLVGKKDGVFGPGDAIEFYGVGLDIPATDTRVYWLSEGLRLGKMIEEHRSVGGQISSSSFAYTVEKKDRTVYFSALKNGEEENFFGPVIYQPREELLEVKHPDPAPPGEALLEVSLQGVTSGPHRVKVRFNSDEVGEIVFEGQSLGMLRVEVSHSEILEGENLVSLIPEGGEMDLSLLDTIRLTYWHTYRADDNGLRLTARGGEGVSIDGFSHPRIRVFDITEPNDPIEVIGKVRFQERGYAISFRVPGHEQRTLLALTEEKVKDPEGVVSNHPSSWHQNREGYDLVMITHRDFLDNLQPLKKLRESQGLRVALVDVEDLYDEFSFGAKSPKAIKDFLSLAKGKWRRVPRFVLLVGDASSDPKNYLGLGDMDYVPTKLIDTTYMETASDDWFLDLNNDGLPEMAIGRLPVQTVEEAAIVVSKIVGYERSNRKNEAILVADRVDNSDEFNFEGASEEVGALLPAYLRVRKILRGKFGSDAQAKAELLNGINEGPLLVNFIGHGSVEFWRGDLLTSDDAEALTNAYRLPFFVSMTCLNGFFQTPYGDTLAEALLKAKGGGAVAVWTSSGMTEPDKQAVMNKELIRLLFNNKEALTIGEAAIRAKASVSDQDIRRTWILFGDPTTRLK